MLYNVFFITNAVNTIGYRPMLYSLSVANPQVSSTLASKSKSTAATFCRLWLRRQCGRAIMLQNATLYVQERYRDVTSFCSFSVIFIGHYWCRDLTCNSCVRGTEILACTDRWSSAWPLRDAPLSRTVLRRNSVVFMHRLVVGYCSVLMCIVWIVYWLMSQSKPWCFCRCTALSYLRDELRRPVDT